MAFKKPLIPRALQPRCSCASGRMKSFRARIMLSMFRPQRCHKSIKFVLTLVVSSQLLSIAFLNSGVRIARLRRARNLQTGTLSTLSTDKAVTEAVGNEPNPKDSFSRSGACISNSCYLLANAFRPGEFYIGTFLQRRSHVTRQRRGKKSADEY